MSGQSYARRAVLRGAAGAGAIGLVAAAGAGTIASASAAQAAPDTSPEHAQAATDTPVVVYVRDASSGDLEIFAGTSRTQVHDPALAARLARAIAVR